MTLHKKLAHLTPEQVDDLVTRYNDDEKLASLVEAFNIDAKPAGLVHLLPPVVHKNLLCFYCKDTNLISKRPARTFEPRRPEPPHCPECGHTPADWCPCKPCREKDKAERRLMEKKKQDLLDATSTREIDVPSPEDLTLRDAVFLLALVRNAVTDGLGYLKPVSEFAKSLAPLYGGRCDILLHLYQRGLIAISPGNDVRAFVFDPAVTEIADLDPSRVLWTFLPGLEEAGKRGYLKRLKTLVNAGDWLEGSSREVVELWHDIVKNECVAYFWYLLDERECDPHPLDQKTHALFDRLLVDFPLSRIFDLCRQVVTKTIDDFNRNNTPYLDRSIYEFIDAIQKTADEAKAQGRELTYTDRIDDYPQTDVSATFFNDFLRLGNNAFEIIPPRPDRSCRGRINIDQSGSLAADSHGPE